MPGSSTADARALLIKDFDARHVDAALGHFSAAVQEYEDGEWELCIIKGGKCVEAVLKALAVHTKITWDDGRKFKVDQVLKGLENLAVGSFNDSVRVTIPRNCRFTYDIASNRGARHDPHEVAPNKMDAVAVLACISWVLAELVRLSSKGSVMPAEAAGFIESLTEKRYPGIEDVDGKTYINFKDISARDVALLLLNRKYPGRIGAGELLELLVRHSFTLKNAKMALERIKIYIDVDEDENLKLRANGRELAAAILAKAKK